MARIVVAGFHHETNWFMPGRTTLAQFESDPTVGGILRGEEMAKLWPLNWCVAGFREVALAANHEIIPILFAQAEPGPMVESAAFEYIAKELVKGIANAGPIDACFLDLHGAMSTEDHEDGDLVLLERVRAVIPPQAPLIATLDLHANISPGTVSAADLLVAYRTYPHVDMAETGRRAAAALPRLLFSREQVKRAHRYLPFMVPVNRQCTLEGSAEQLYALLDAHEDRHGLLSLSLTMGFQPADIECPLPAVFAYGFDQRACDEAVGRIAEDALRLEPTFDYDYLSAEEAAQQAVNWQGSRPLAIADAQDNPGGGGSSDTMFLARACLTAGVRGATIAAVCDPTAAAAAHRAGTGGTIDCDLGGMSVEGDAPLRGLFEVVATAVGPAEMSGEMLAGASIDLGPCALLRRDGLDFIVISRRVQCVDVGFFSHLGVDPADCRVLILKSALHFRAAFGPLVGRIIDVAAPGYETMRYSDLPYSRLKPGTRFWGAGPAHQGGPTDGFTS